MNFDLEKFRLYVKDQIVWIGKSPRSLKEDQILDAICQFEKTPREHLNLQTRNYIKMFHRIFDLTEKPDRVQINNWFLHNFGFKRCSKCTRILPTKVDYTFCFDNWDKVESICKTCKRVKKQLAKNK